MTIQAEIRRTLGTMVVYGFPRGDVAIDLAIATGLGAEVLEILPHWPAFPDPVALKARVADAGLAIHSAHGCWGGQTIRAPRVDLGSLDAATWSASLADLARCVDWLALAGGSCLVVHPGGLSDPEEAPRRREALATGLIALADHARGTGVTLCVENMPPGVHPGSRMTDLFALVDGLGRPEVALALDTGHAHIAEGAEAATLAAGRLLATTHVHDNNGRSDSHLPPGLGSIEWEAWVLGLDRIGYRGPIVLECIKHLRSRPDCLDRELLDRLRKMCRLDRS